MNVILRMLVDGDTGSTSDWDDRWNHIKKFLERSGPFMHPDFEPSTEALSGFRNIHVVDMDTIDVSNLNRQFLFRAKDVGRPKADVAADFINSQFHIIVCGLDSIVARRWMNGMLEHILNLSLLVYEDGVLDPSSIIPLIDGGTEGFKGNARVIFPGMTACIDCTLELYPPQINFPMCTIASMPRLPEHCIEYVRILLWPKEMPFGDDVSLDGDDPEHIQWVYQKSLERAAEFSITGVTYRLTQGVVKRIIPAVASTNAAIAAACATEVFKIASSAYLPLNNYMVFNDVDGLYTYTFEAERKENCSACSQVPSDLHFSPSSKLQEVLDYLTESTSVQMKSPAITTTMDGKNKTLYLQVINLPFKLGLADGQELAVADVTTPQTVLFKLCFTS
uniref:NEDD8-activating enzyme E1 catalytic subunit n=1 Tax=Astatotilapia calliptera TaxID=8154 RepID=A0AAX7T450_ASTCA